MKMYKQPKTDVVAFATNLMQGLSTMSPVTGGGGGGSNDAPRRRGDIID